MNRHLVEAMAELERAALAVEQLEDTVREASIGGHLTGVLLRRQEKARHELRQATHVALIAWKAHVHVSKQADARFPFVMVEG